MYLAGSAVLTTLPATVSATLSVERRIAAEQNIHDDSKAPQVATLVVRVGLSNKGLHHLRRHELSTAHWRQELRRRQRRAQRAVELYARSQVKVADLHWSQLVPVDTEDVFRLQVTVSNSYTQKLAVQLVFQIIYQYT